MSSDDIQYKVHDYDPVNKYIDDLVNFVKDLLQN